MSGLFPGEECFLRLPNSMASDREALVVFHHATEGPDWEDNEGWLSDSPHWRMVRRHH